MITLIRLQGREPDLVGLESEDSCYYLLLQNDNESEVTCRLRQIVDPNL